VPHRTQFKLNDHQAELTLERRQGGVLLTVEAEPRPDSSAGVNALMGNVTQLQRHLNGLPVRLSRQETQRRMVSSLREVQALTPFRLSQHDRDRIEAFLAEARR